MPKRQGTTTHHVSQSPHQTPSPLDIAFMTTQPAGMPMPTLGQHCTLGAQPGSPPQWQALALQVSPALHAWPHMPQLFMSVTVFEQAPEQHDCPAVHPGLRPQRQLPPLQISPALHMRPHMPQL